METTSYIFTSSTQLLSNNTIAADKPSLGKSPAITEPQNPLPTIDFPTISSAVMNLGATCNTPWRTSTRKKYCSRAQGATSMVWGRGTPVSSVIICYMTSAHGLLRLFTVHPFHYQYRLLSYLKPVKGAMAKSKCVACGKSVKGYTFRCNTCNFQMHPCCAMLPGEIVFSSHPHALKLLPSIAIPSGDAGFMCGECKKKKLGRVCRCMVCKYHLHAVCAKAIFNGLPDCGIEGVDRPSVRVAALVIKDFVSGGVEGTGQGLGNDIVQNLVNGGSFKSVTLNDTISHHRGAR